MAKIKFSSFKGIDASTCHITRKDDNVLGASSLHLSFPFILDRKAYGYMVHITSDTAKHAISLARKAGLSRAFANLYRAAANQGARVLIIDADAPEVSGLPKFDW